VRAADIESKRKVAGDGFFFICRKADVGTLFYSSIFLDAKICFQRPSRASSVDHVGEELPDNEAAWQEATRESYSKISTASSDRGKIGP
jgi:hypothetical protein